MSCVHLTACWEMRSNRVMLHRVNHAINHVCRCRVARIDKVMAAHMKVSWYGKHNGRWTLARHGAGPDEGQVRTGDVSLSDHQVLAVFDRFTGNKDVSSDVLRIATARLCSIVGQDTVVDQENITVHDYA